jgi:hypothetical protein
MNSRKLAQVVFAATAVVILSFSAVVLRAGGPGDHGSTAQQEEFRWKLKAGQKFKVQVDQKMTQRIDMGTGEQEMPMSFAMFMSWTVDEATEDEFKITQTIDRVTLAMTLPGMGDIEYDSHSAEEPEGMAVQFAGVLEPLIGLKIHQTLNGRGESVECEIDADALEALNSAGMGAQFASEDTLKNLIGQSACVFPELAVSQGDSWNDEFSVMNQMGKMITSAKYTYDGPEEVDGKSLQKISVESTVAVEGTDDAPVEVEIKEQENKGTVWFDNAAGYITSATGTQKMTMTVVTMGQEISLVTDGTSSFTVTPDDGSSE